ncbi:MAG: helix-turn-helix domain-containing protein, partial [Candidatus Omnitrophica bacterium]|nr:helix-turn-helix domain-containing protein [Candidatus Omnitrophota bacterium]
MKNIKRNSINKRLKVIKMAEKLTNISEACRKLRVSRTQFYDYKKRFAQEGPKGLLIRPPVHKSYPFSIPDDNKDKIINYALGHPKYGCHRLSKALKGAGVGVSGATIQKILKKQNLETSRKRITEIENNFTKHRTDLSKEQADIIEARNPCFRERDNASSVPGELLCHDLFYLRDLKGNVRIYIQILLETYGGFVIALAHEYHHPTFLGEFLNRHVVPQYRDWGINIKAILTDQNDGFYSEKRNN